MRVDSTDFGNDEITLHHVFNNELGDFADTLVVDEFKAAMVRAPRRGREEALRVDRQLRRPTTPR